MKLAVLLFIIIGVLVATATLGFVLVDYIQEKKNQKDAESNSTPTQE